MALGSNLGDRAAHLAFARERLGRVPGVTVRGASSVEETAVYEAEVQARLMLVAASSYVCETARIGYDTTSGPDHLEAFGWIDVRDGSEGPNTRGSTPTGATTIVPLWRPDLVERSRPGSPDRPAWPAKGGVARCPMYTMVRPPYAVELTSVYNPIETNSASAVFGQPLLKNKDPQPLMKTWQVFTPNDITPLLPLTRNAARNRP